MRSMGLHWSTSSGCIGVLYTQRPWTPKDRTKLGGGGAVLLAANDTMSATTSIEVQPEAYCLMFLHACKYPARAVNGLLLGTAAGDSVKVQKALPLFHSSFALSPMLETALMLVRSALQRAR